MASSPRVLLVSPRFSANSFWSLGETCRIDGKRYTAPPLGLLTLAALLPATWQVRVLDANVEALKDADIEWADLVMTGGMLPQVPDMLALIVRCKAQRRVVCVGGPAVSSSPEFAEKADFVVLGEAETIIDDFVAAWDGGARSGRFEAVKFSADVTKSPIPRYELIDFKNYMQIGVQYSRGCPFNCEFCDIIELYGRVPRNKGNAQMLAELDRLYELGYRGHVEFVDDNLIGNKKALKKFLPELKAWQVARRYPFEFGTEASINLADDDELLAMLKDANFFGIFIGIESDNAEVLFQAQKKQNTRRSIDASINKIYSSGIFVLAGFIVGFDNESGNVAENSILCIEATNIPVAMVGLLTALPNTQMTRRLEREGRLYAGWNDFAPEHSDQCTAGLNFVTVRPRRTILNDYKTVLETVYAPKAFFARLTRMTQALRLPGHKIDYGPGRLATDVKAVARLLRQLVLHHPTMLLPFFRLLILTLRKNPRAVVAVLQHVSIYMHVGPFAKQVCRELDAQIAISDRGHHPADIARPALQAAE